MNAFTVQDVDNINYFNTYNRQLYNPYYGDDLPRPSAHGIAEWLIGLLVCGLIVFLLVLFYEMSM